VMSTAHYCTKVSLGTPVTQRTSTGKSVFFMKVEVVVHRTHSAVFVGIAGADNNIPSVFVERQFIDRWHRSLKEGGGGVNR